LLLAGPLGGRPLGPFAQAAQFRQRAARLLGIDPRDRYAGVHDDKVALDGLWNAGHVAAPADAFELDFGGCHQRIAIDPPYDPARYR
jgi:hypothetical protein